MNQQEISTLREFISLVREGEWFGELGQESCAIIEKTINREAKLNWAFGENR